MSDPITIVGLITVGVQGIIGNRADAGFTNSAVAIARRITNGPIPENHHVLKAMHASFVESIAIMTRACDSVGGSPADHFSRRALQQYAKSKDLNGLRLDAVNLPFDQLEAQIRTIYGQQGVAPKSAATAAVIFAVERAIGNDLTEAMRSVFLDGHGRFGGWADTFELFFADKVKRDTNVFRIITFDRLNELVAMTEKQAGQLEAMSGDLALFRNEMREGFSETQRLIRADKHEQTLIDIRQGHLTSDEIEEFRRVLNVQMEQQPNVSEFDAARFVETTVALAESPDSERREIAALIADGRNLQAAAARAALVDRDRADGDARNAAGYREAAEIASPFSALTAIGYYRKALGCDGDDVWTWIALLRLHIAAGSLTEARRCAERAEQLAVEPRDMMVVQNELGDIALAAGSLPIARGYFLRGMDAAEKGVAAYPDNAGWQRDLSVSHDRLGEVAVAMGDLGEARTQFGRGLGIAEQLAAADPGNAGWQRDLSVSHNKLGDVAVAMGDLGEARTQFGRGLGIREQLAAADPGNAGWQRDLSVSHDRLGEVAVAMGDLGEARTQFGRGLGIAEQLVAADPGNAGWQHDLFVSHAKLAGLAMQSGDSAGALVALLKGEVVIAALAALRPDHPGFRRDLERVRGELARLRGL